MASAPMSKGDVRRLLRARRRRLAAARDLTADASAIAEHLDSLPAGAGPRSEPATVLSYESLPHEPPTAAINAALRARGDRVLVPITLPDMQLDWCDLDDPGRTPFGIDAPTHADLVLAPGLAVDTAGTRLGQGGGCYDRVLPMLPTGTPVIVLLHPGEHTDERLPSEEHDIPVPWVLTAKGCTPTHRVLGTTAPQG
ncbi:5-formyltetrahydrofolate cyclo-ligase [Janibacter limosus]|uniref:5-formyltetrahydrofolate cyclo-ligase n=1 Tax=Janibacter limosus TaxID=53458 RepID=A0A4P6MYL3_9MICO|nr:5-formyltetrahydrofolate cyclo-ligase [Janibacter limosus]QBF47065.1 5-formyltetrahydrofolate cyclo-ligase [Janibacter limosus]